MINSWYELQGFLVTAVDVKSRRRAGSWTIPFADTSSQYLHCSGLQDTVTHTDHSSPRYLLSLQWSPSHHYSGNVSILAWVVLDHQTSWSPVTSDIIHVISEDEYLSSEIVGINIRDRDFSDHEDYDDYQEYQEDNSVLESVVVTQMLVDFQKRSTGNQVEPSHSSSSSTPVSDDDLEPESRVDTTSYRSVLLWPSRSKESTTSRSRSGLRTTTEEPVKTTSTFDAWWRLPVTVAVNTQPDKFFRPTFFAADRIDDDDDQETTTRRSVLMQPRPKTTTRKTSRATSARPIPTLNTLNIDTSNNNNDIKIPVFISHNSVDRNDNVGASTATESDIGVIPFYHDYELEDDMERFKKTVNYNQNSHTTIKYKDKKINIPEIDAELLDERVKSLDAYAKIESEHGSWENGSDKLSCLTCLIIYTLLQLLQLLS